MTKKQHGGANRNQGRRLGRWGKRRLLSIKCTDAEFERIKSLGTRERAEALLVAANALAIEPILKESPQSQP